MPPKRVPETEYGRDARIVHEDLVNALFGVGKVVLAAYEGSTETMVDYVQAKQYVDEKMDAMIALLEQDDEQVDGGQGDE